MAVLARVLPCWSSVALPSPSGRSPAPSRLRRGGTPFTLCGPSPPSPPRGGLPPAGRLLCAPSGPRPGPLFYSPSLRFRACLCSAPWGLLAWQGLLSSLRGFSGGPTGDCFSDLMFRRGCGPPLPLASRGSFCTSWGSSPEHSHSPRFIAPSLCDGGGAAWWCQSAVGMSQRTFLSAFFPSSPPASPLLVGPRVAKLVDELGPAPGTACL